MNARPIIGKTIAAIAQTTETRDSGRVTTIEAIEFTDGSTLRFIVLTEGAVAIEPIYPARPIEPPEKITGPARVRCVCTRCEQVRHLLPADVGAPHNKCYIGSRDLGRFMPKARA